MKGIILAGGKGTRLYPLTKSISKQLLPIYDKPMIYYPLSILMLLGIREILIISTENDITKFEQLLGNGNNIGISISYKIQPSPDGIPQAFVLGEEFIGNDNVALILGDNIFYGQGFSPRLRNAAEHKTGATIFCYRVKDPSSFGTIEFDENDKVIALKEKPEYTNSNYAVTGLYFYDNNVIEIAKSLKPSCRGELEIMDINNIYLSQNKLNVEILGRGFAWLDTGTHDSLLMASQFIEALDKRQGLKIACIEEIAYHMKYISKEQLIKLSDQIKNTEYGKYLNSIIKNSSSDIVCELNSNNNTNKGLY